MGLLGAIGNGLAEAGGAVANIGLVQIKSAIEEERQSRLVELQSQTKLREDATTRERNQEDAQTERDRVSGLLSEPVPVSQGDGMLAPATGDTSELNAASRKPTNDEMIDRAVAAGDLKTAADVGKLNDKDAANATRMKIAEMQQSAAFAKMDAQYQLGVLKLDSMLARAEASGKAPTQVQQIEYLIQNGMPRDKATDLVYHADAKVGEYTTTQTESMDAQGNKVTTTKKVKPNSQETAAPKKVIKFGELK